MKKHLFLITILLLNLPVFAQETIDGPEYAVVTAKDGYVNIRKSPSTTARIVGKLYNDDILSCEASNGNWWQILYQQPGLKTEWVEGFVRQNQVELITKWRRLRIKSKGINATIFKNDSLVITIAKSKFQKNNHLLSFLQSDKPHDPKALIKIDSRTFWGTDGEIPKNVIKELAVSLNGSSISIPTNAFDDLYEPQLADLSITSVHGRFYLLMKNSDGAGAYSVIWIFKNRKYLNRYIDTGED